MKPTHAALLAGGLVVGGCSLLAELLGLANLFLLGVIPDSEFSNPDAADYGLVEVALGGEDDGGLPIAPPRNLLEVDSDQSDVEVEDSEEVKGHDQGSLVFLADGSGSMYDSDPDYLRKDAAAQLAKALSTCGPDWRMSLMMFGAGATDDFTDTSVLVDYTTDAAAIAEGAELLGDYGGTPLYDSLTEVLSDLDSDAKGSFEGGDPGRGLVVLSDGEDTESGDSLDDIISKANNLGIAVHAVGLGDASDLAGGTSQAVEDLRRLASETGGYFGAVSEADELPALADAIAKAHCGGHTKLRVRFKTPPDSGEEVTGNVRIKDTDVGVPFRFIAP